MGPKAAGEIAALNTLTDDQLDQYVALWQEKTSLAKQEADVELESTRADNQMKLAQLVSDASTQLTQYRQEWSKATSDIKETTKKDLQSLVDEATKMGTAMVVKLAAAISASMPQLAGFVAPGCLCHA